MMYRGPTLAIARRASTSAFRRRLAPLLEHRRRNRIELMNALLLSLPGTPVLYYGDEIGMGDNVYLGDRNGVRTPMQWSADRNGGFSRANPQKLYLPTIIDPEYHYEAINVEAQQSNSASQLWWMKRVLAKRKEHPVFGRGSIAFIASDNPRVISFVREFNGEQVLVIANLSRFTQGARLDLTTLKGMVPTELFGRMRFPEISDAPYFVSLGAFDFYWFTLAPPAVADAPAVRPALVATGAWTTVLEPKQRPQLVRALLHYAEQRRWYRGKAQSRKSAQIADVIMVGDAAIVMLAIEYERGSATYVIPVAFTEGAEPNLVIANVALANGVSGVLYDAVCSDTFDQMLLAVMRGGTDVAKLRGTALRELETGLPARATAVDQTNSGVIYGDRLLLKLFRVLEEGASSELEIGRYLDQQGYRGVAPLAGWLETPRSTLGTLHEYIPNHGDAWQLTQDALDRYFDRLVSDDKRPDVPPLGPISERVHDWIGPVANRIRLLGERTAELHLVLAAATEPLFAPEPYDIMHQQSMYGSASAQVSRTFDLMRARLPHLSPELRELAEQTLSRESSLDRLLASITRHRIDVVRTRVHGDYHLGQVLWTGEDFVIVDFEGEPGRPISQRRVKRSPLRDVAGMIRSLHYASAAALRNGKHRPEDVAMLRPWARAWSEWNAVEFLDGYLGKAQGSRILPRRDGDLRLLLDFFLVEKCVYEIGYELDNRPEWAEIPLHGLLTLLGEPA